MWRACDAVDDVELPAASQAHVAAREGQAGYDITDAQSPRGLVGVGLLMMHY